MTHDIIEAEDGLEAYNLLEDHPDFDLIVLDWVMPVCDGMQFLEKAKRRFGDTPVMMMTGINDKEQVMNALRAGADDYIAKPFENEKMLEKASELLQKKAVPAT